MIVAWVKADMEYKEDSTQLWKTRILKGHIVPSQQKTEPYMNKEAQGHQRYMETTAKGAA